jgi:hypothetical protein
LRHPDHVDDGTAALVQGRICRGFVSQVGHRITSPKITLVKLVRVY